MKFTRKISLMLALLTLAGAVSCGGEGGSNDTTTVGGDTTPADSTDTEPAVTLRTDIDDELPEKNFGGKTFKMITYDTIAADLIAESETGDVVSDAVFKRNQNVAERFNVKIETKGDLSWDSVSGAVRSSVLAGDDEYQLSAGHVMMMSGILMDDVLMNWYDVPYIDFSKPWWAKSTVNDLSYKEKCTPFAVGDLALSALSYAYCYYFDKQGIDEYKLENPYDVVNEGRWTLDYLMNVSKDIYRDLNGDNERDNLDFYGVSQCKTSAVDALLWACGGKVIDKDQNGELQIVYGDEKTVNIFEKVYKFCLESPGVRVDREYKAVHRTAEYAFRDNLSVFASGNLNSSGAYFRERKGEYGILPYPKFDDAQAEYRTMVDGSHAVLAVPKTVSDPEFVGIITEALNAESFKHVVPAYYEVALKVKYSHDDESAKMIDLVSESRIFDMGYVYDNWKGVSFYFEQLIGAEDNNIVSHIETYAASAAEYYAGVIEYLSSMGE